MSKSFSFANSAKCQWCVCLLILLSLTTGCAPMRLAANLIHAAKGNEVVAKFDGLKQKTVAVVCVSNSEAFGPRPVSAQVADRVSKRLSANVEGITIVDQQKIDSWVDQNEWNQLDHRALGKGVGADMVVAIDLGRFSIHEGKTIYKGRADVQIIVHDVVEGRDVFAYGPPQIQYPKNSVVPSTSVSDYEFQRRFIEILAGRIGRNFYSYDAKEDFAIDATFISAITP